MSPQKQIRVVVADPLPVFRYGVRRLLDGTRHLRWVAEAVNAGQVIETVQKHNPDVMLLAQEFADESTGLLDTLAASTQVRCIVVSQGPPVTSVAARPPVGCALSRTAPSRAFVHCVECVLLNQCFPAAECRDKAPAVTPEARTQPNYKLTRRENEIVAAVADGRSNKDIAEHLAISEVTVKHHLSHIFDKFGVHSRLELVLFAMYHGLIDILQNIDKM